MDLIFPSFPILGKGCNKVWINQIPQVENWGPHCICNICDKKESKKEWTVWFRAFAPSWCGPRHIPMFSPTHPRRTRSGRQAAPWNGQRGQSTWPCRLFSPIRPNLPKPWTQPAPKRIYFYFSLPTMFCSNQSSGGPQHPDTGRSTSFQEAIQMPQKTKWDGIRRISNVADK